MENQSLISSFLEIAACESAITAELYLQATRWNLEEAIVLFFSGTEGYRMTSSPSMADVIPTGWEDYVAYDDAAHNVGDVVDGSGWDDDAVDDNATHYVGGGVDGSERGDYVADDNVTHYVGNGIDGHGWEDYVADDNATHYVGSGVDGSGWDDDVADDDATHYVGDGVDAPLPVRRETLYDEDIYARQHPEELEPRSIWESNESTASTTNGSCDLASMFHTPIALMYNGPFEKAKVKAAQEDKWLLVNLQSAEVFSSHMLNRDTWSNGTVEETIRSNFIFWQVDQNSTEGQKVRTYYNLLSFPAILVIEPITGQRKSAWSGMIQPVDLLEGLLPYLDIGPNYHITLPCKHPRQTAQTSILTSPGKAPEEGLSSSEASLEALSIAADDIKTTEKDPNGKPVYLPLPEEPQGGRELCRVRIRFPDGRKIDRNFFRTDSIKLLWSFCCAQLGEERERPFHFCTSVPSASRLLDYGSDQTFEESSLSNSLLALVWDETATAYL